MFLPINLFLSQSISINGTSKNLVVLNPKIRLYLKYLPTTFPQPINLYHMSCSHYLQIKSPHPTAHHDTLD